jgi:hypothetical protein
MTCPGDRGRARRNRGRLHPRRTRPPRAGARTGTVPPLSHRRIAHPLHQRPPAPSRPHRSNCWSRSAFVRKFSVQFVQPNGRRQPAVLLLHPLRHRRRPDLAGPALGVRPILVDHARSKRGAEVREETEVLALLREDDRRWSGSAFATEIRGGVRTDRAITLDCSGKESFAAVRNGWRMKDPKSEQGRGLDLLRRRETRRGHRRRRDHRGVRPRERLVLVHPAARQPGQRRRGGRGQIPDPWRGEGSAGDLRTRDPRERLDRRPPRSPDGRRGRITSPASTPFIRGIADPKACCWSATPSVSSIRSSPPASCSRSRAASRPGDASTRRSRSGDFAPERSPPYARHLRQGIENMRKLVYAFYEPELLLQAGHRPLPGTSPADITDCLSGDVNKDFSRLWSAIREFVAVPPVLPVGDPLGAPQGVLAGASA